MYEQVEWRQSIENFERNKVGFCFSGHIYIHAHYNMYMYSTCMYTHDTIHINLSIEQTKVNNAKHVQSIIYFIIYFNFSIIRHGIPIRYLPRVLNLICLRLSLGWGMLSLTTR